MANKEKFQIELYDKDSVLRVTMFAVGQSFDEAIARGRVTSSVEEAIRLKEIRQSLTSDRGIAIYGFDVFVDKDSNHWNA